MKRNFGILGLYIALAATGGQSAFAASTAQTYEAREKALNYLVAHQDASGRIGSGVSDTAYALLALTSEWRTNDTKPAAPHGPLGQTGHASDFVLTASQQAAVAGAVSYIEATAQRNSPTSVHWNGEYHANAETALATMALLQAAQSSYSSGYAACRLDCVVPQGAASGVTIQTLADSAFNYLAFTQIGIGSPEKGLWGHIDGVNGAAETVDTALVGLSSISSDRIYAGGLSVTARGSLANGVTLLSQYAQTPGAYTYADFGITHLTNFLSTVPGLIVQIATGNNGPSSVQNNLTYAYLNSQWQTTPTDHDSVFGTQLYAGNKGNFFAMWMLEQIASGTDYIGFNSTGHTNAFNYDVPFYNKITNLGDCGSGESAPSGGCNWLADYNQWLVQHQNADGSFIYTGMAPDVYDTIATTAMAGSILVGYSDTPGVPEPALWSMMILGFGLVGAAVRQRRSLPSDHGA